MKAFPPHSAFFLRWPFWLASFAVLSLSSCDSEKRAAKALISERGVTVSADSLFEALDSGDASLAGALVTAKVAPSSRDALERTPLMLAAGGAAPSLVRKLVDEGADLEAQDSTGRTALSYAVEAGQLDAVVSLLDEGADSSISVDTGGSLAAQALRQNRQAAVLLLLEAGADPNSKGFNGEPLARIAVEENQPAVLADLVERGLDLNTASGSDDSGLLHLALERGQDNTAHFLLENGMDPDEKNVRGETLLHAAVSRSKLRLLEPLKKHGASFDALDPQGWSALHLAILSHDYELVNTLLNLGADVDQYSNQGSESIPPLSLAIENNLFPIARLLLRYGAKPRDEVYQAVKRGGQDGFYLVKLLLESGASPSPARAPALDSPIGLATRKGEYEIAKALLEAGAPHELRDVCGQKPLHIAVAKGHTKLTKLFLDAGADPNEPFHPKITESFLELVNTNGVGRWALQKSSDLLPIMLAADSGKIEMAKLLMDNGATTKKRTKVYRNWMYPLSFATRRSDVDMIQVILGREPGRSKNWVKVDLSSQRAYLYENEKQVYSTRISSGKSGHRTRRGKFIITNKYRNWTSTLYGSSMPYFQRLSSSDFGFHVGALPGYPASHGCIRMPYSAARKLFGITKVGDYVEIVQ